MATYFTFLNIFEISSNSACVVAQIFHCDINIFTSKCFLWEVLNKFQLKHLDPAVHLELIYLYLETTLNDHRYTSLLIFGKHEQINQLPFPPEVIQ